MNRTIRGRSASGKTVTEDTPVPISSLSYYNHSLYTGLGKLVDTTEPSARPMQLNTRSGSWVVDSPTFLTQQRLHSDQNSENL